MDGWTYYKVVLGSSEEPELCSEREFHGLPPLSEAEVQAETVRLAYAQSVDLL